MHNIGVQNLTTLTMRGTILKLTIFTAYMSPKSITLSLEDSFFLDLEKTWQKLQHRIIGHVFLRVQSIGR